jgi:hypothetical protein
VPGAPAVIASASVIIGQKTGWFGAAKFRYLGPRPLIEDDSVRSGPMRVVNANVGYRFEKPFSCSQRFDGLDDAVDQRRQTKVSRLSSIRPTHFSLMALGRA